MLRSRSLRAAVPSRRRAGRPAMLRAAIFAMVLVSDEPAETMEAVMRPEATRSVRLPAPRERGECSVEESLARRRSIRRFASTPLALADLGQLLWAAQGVTDDEGRRAAPSAGALYPIELLVVAGVVSGLPAGVYRYRPEGHRLDLVVEGDARRRLLPAVPWQSWVADAPVVLAVAGVVSRTAAKYGPRAERYVLLEAGAVTENVYLQAAALGLATVLVGSFDDARLSTALSLADGQLPLGLMPLGAPQ
jgi:SagB-type dehydrogenase family enzyme